MGNPVPLTDVISIPDGTGLTGEERQNTLRRVAWDEGVVFFVGIPELRIRPCIITLCVIQDQKKNDIFHENLSGTFIYPVISSVLIGNGCSSTMSPEIFLNLPPAYENRYS